MGSFEPYLGAHCRCQSQAWQDPAVFLEIKSRPRVNEPGKAFQFLLFKLPPEEAPMTNETLDGIVHSPLLQGVAPLRMKPSRIPGQHGHRLGCNLLQNLAL